MSILVGKHIDQAAFDTAQGQRTLPVVIGDRVARGLNRATVVAMYITVAVLVALVGLALPRALRAARAMSAARPASAPDGYVGWPLWYHRVCLVHNRVALHPRAGGTRHRRCGAVIAHRRRHLNEAASKSFTLRLPSYRHAAPDAARIRHGQ
jgi:hypothetical protein